MAERRKGWFGRQMNRFSIRSASTTYSSGGLFKRNRNNSVYSSPEAGITQPIAVGAPMQKISFYDKFVRKKSGHHPRQIVKQSKNI